MVSKHPKALIKLLPVLTEHTEGELQTTGETCERLEERLPGNEDLYAVEYVELKVGCTQNKVSTIETIVAKLKDSVKSRKSAAGNPEGGGWKVRLGGKMCAREKNKSQKQPCRCGHQFAKDKPARTQLNSTREV